MLSPDVMQFVPLIAWYIITAVPTYMIIRRTGKSPWLTLFLVIPLAGFVILLWTLAYARWPAVSRVP
jgi:hypothetical protein